MTTSHSTNNDSSRIAAAITLTVICSACAARPGPSSETPQQSVVSREVPSAASTDRSPPASEAAPCPNALPPGTDSVLSEQAPPDVSAIPAYAHVNPSGLASCVVRPGDAHQFPRPDDRVTVHYVGWSTSGVVFDSSIQRARPATFPLRAVIAGWTEGVGMMTPGEVRRLWIPEALAYRGHAGRPAGMLIFDVELIRIEPAESTGQ